MPKKPETRLYENLREHLSNCLFTRIESWVNQGLPDCLLAFQNGPIVPVELKVVLRGKKVGIRAHQASFHMRYAANGNPTFIIVQYHPPARTREPIELRLYRGSQAVDLLEKGIDTEPLERWPIMAVPWRILGMRLDGGC